MDNGITSINANTLDLLNLRGQTTTTGGGRGNASLAWQLTGDKRTLENTYATQIENCELLKYINTEGSLWIDRVNVPISDIQRQRLGGIALVRNSLFPGHAVGWDFHAPANDQSVALIIPDATRTHFKVIACNLDNAPVTATMTGWNIDPGEWEYTQGIDSNGDDIADGQTQSHRVKFERSSSVDLTFPPRATTILTFDLRTPGTPYWKRPDLAICKEDVVITGQTVNVTVHSIGSTDAPAATLRLLDKSGKELASAPVPALKAPQNLDPVRTQITLTLPAGASLSGGSVQLDSGTEEITQRNNRVQE